MNTLELYAHFSIMPGLANHMFRVAGVVAQLCAASTTQVSQDRVVRAALLHDMGNIVKSDFSVMPELLEPQGVDFWRSVKHRFIEMYGPDEHVATAAIVAQLVVPERIQQIISRTNFSQLAADLHNHDFEVMICHYADLRVAPHGVVSLEERLKDLEKRYAARYPTPEDQTRRDSYARAARALEAEVVTHASLNVRDITESSVQLYRPELEAMEWEFRKV